MATLPFSVVAKNLKTRHVDTVAYPGNGVAGGQAAITRTRLPRNFVVQDINILVTGTVSVSGGSADGTLTPEQPLQLIRDVRIEGSSQSRPQVGEIKRGDAAALYRFAHFMKGTAGSITSLAAAGVQTNTAFSFDLEIDFELARSIDPRMTLLNTRELDSLDLVIQWEDSTGLIYGGDRSVTINNCSAYIVAREYLDPGSLATAYGIHRFSSIEQAISAANTRLPIELKRGYLLRGLFIKQFTQGAVNYHTPVTSIINAVSVEVNRDVKVSYPSWAQLVAENKYSYSIESMPTGYAFVDFMIDGKPDNLIDTRDFESVDLVLNVSAPSNARVRVYPIEILPVPGR